MRITHDALTFDDVLLKPAYSEILPREVSLRTHVTRGITLNIPILSAAMDTVTEARLAIALAQEGGMGIIHKNMSPADQARQVAQVKKYESGIVNDPDHRPAGPDHPRGAGHHPRPQHLRRAGGGQGPHRRHRHQSRPALRDAPRRARCRP